MDKQNGGKERSEKEKTGGKKWWDRNCSRKKRKVRKALMEWRKGEKLKTEYLEERKKWRRLCYDRENEVSRIEIEQIKRSKTKYGNIWTGQGRGLP